VGRSRRAHLSSEPGAAGWKRLARYRPGRYGIRVNVRNALDRSHRHSGAHQILARDRGLTALSVSYNLRFVETYGSAGIAALGDPTRRAIFESLARRPKAVGELAAELPVSRPAVSQHLRVLKEAGLVTDRADGTRRIYQIHQQGVQAIHGYLDQMWGQAMTAFQAEARQVASQAPGGSPAPELPASPRPGAAGRARDRGS
jgi:DNA-binding transcriptional ArsR family regulator